MATSNLGDVRVVPVGVAVENGHLGRVRILKNSLYCFLACSTISYMITIMLYVVILACAFPLYYLDSKKGREEA